MSPFQFHFPALDFVWREGQPGEGFVLGWFPVSLFPDLASVLCQFNADAPWYPGWKGLRFVCLVIALF